jgi:hypothetical protein|tara:strand:- start:145 stop:393 length:249 start_codon:yes stop_codon:yes gene_type:complete
MDQNEKVFSMDDVKEKVQPLRPLNEVIEDMRIFLTSPFKDQVLKEVVQVLVWQNAEIMKINKRLFPKAASTKGMAPKDAVVK